MNLGALQLRALFEHWPSAKPLVTSSEKSEPQRETDKTALEKNEEETGKDGRSEREGEVSGRGDGVEESVKERREEGGVSEKVKKESSSKSKSKSCGEACITCDRETIDQSQCNKSPGCHFQKMNELPWVATTTCI